MRSTRFASLLFVLLFATTAAAQFPSYWMPSGAGVIKPTGAFSVSAPNGFTGALTGTASKASNMVGGNGTTLLGSIPYQSGADTTTLLPPNTTAVRNFLRQLGTGTNGAVPAWDTVTKTDVGLSAVENTTLSTWGGSSHVTTLGTVAACLGFTCTGFTALYPTVTGSHGGVATGIDIEGTITSDSGATQGVFVNPTLVPGANEAYGIVVTPEFTTTGGVTLPNAYGAYVGAMQKNGAGTIGALYGLYLANQTAGTANYSLYCAGPAQFAGSLTGALTGNASTATALATPRAVYGNNFDGSAALTQIIASTYGGTGNGFTKFTGPATAERTFTLPNSDATLLYSGGALGTPSGGTLTNCTFPTLNQDTSGTAGKATNLKGGNTTTLLGSLPYQSAVDTTTLLSPNTTVAKQYLSQTGTGTNGAVPAWAGIAQADVSGLTTASSPTHAGMTLSGLTLGSVLFAGTAGLVSQDNSNLFWDNTNKRLGVGMTGPGQKLAVSGIYTLPGVNGFGTAGQPDSIASIYSTNTAGAGVGGVLEFGGKTGLGTDPYPWAYIQGSQDVGGAYGGRLSFWTTDASSANSEKMRITSTGNVGIGTPVFPTGGGTPVLALGNSTSSITGAPANVAGLQNKAGELYAWDSSSNVTLISPHATDAPPDIYVGTLGEAVGCSYNTYTGIVRWHNADIGKTVYETANAYNTRLSLAATDPGYRVARGKSGWDADEQARLTQVASTLVADQAAFDKQVTDNKTAQSKWDADPKHTGLRPADIDLATRPVAYVVRPYPFTTPDPAAIKSRQLAIAKTNSSAGAGVDQMVARAAVLVNLDMRNEMAKKYNDLLTVLATQTTAANRPALAALATTQMTPAQLKAAIETKLDSFSLAP